MRALSGSRQEPEEQRSGWRRGLRYGGGNATGSESERLRFRITSPGGGYTTVLEAEMMHFRITARGQTLRQPHESLGVHALCNLPE